MTNALFAELRTVWNWPETSTHSPIGSGLINHTWKVDTGLACFVLQRINQAVFQRPDWIDENLGLLHSYLQTYQPEYLFTAPIPTVYGQTLWEFGDAYYRVFAFVPNTHTVDTVNTAEQAFEAAKAFGNFTTVLQHFDATQLRMTIPDFHHLSLRYKQFQDACKYGNPVRIQESISLIQELHQYHHLVQQYEAFINHAQSRLRVTHHDTKISNVLFNDAGKAICVIDLDTVMPGYFISDLGDMYRTYVCPVSEEEKDFSKIVVREDCCVAIEEGYLSAMGQVLSDWERKHIRFSGHFLVYMQALRFLTDHLLYDGYYGAKYPGHNYVRAGNQVHLLRALMKRAS
jgi:Ser/Thr protein kinase RdoA (MazF antagonist)